MENSIYIPAINIEERPHSAPVGSRIKIVRERLGLTQFQMAYWIGVSEKTLSRWERNETQPPLLKFLLWRITKLAADWPHLPGETPSEKLKYLL